MLKIGDEKNFIYRFTVSTVATSDYNTIALGNHTFEPSALFSQSLAPFE